MRAFSVVLFGTILAIGCGKKDLPGAAPPAPQPVTAPTAEDEVKAAAEIRAIVPAAASMPKELLRAVGEGPAIDPFSPKFRTRGSLTFAVLCLDPSWVLEDPTAADEFDFIAQNNPAKIASAFYPRPDATHGTVIQPEYITDVTCRMVGDTAGGVIAFKAEGAYKGKVQYRARQIDGKWMIEEFGLPKWGLTVTRVKDGEWAQKLVVPARPADEVLKSDLSKFQGTWEFDAGRDDFGRRSTRVVSGDTLTETVEYAGKVEVKVVSRLALRLKAGTQTVIFSARKRSVENGPEAEARDEQRGYRFDGDIWVELERAGDGWKEIARWKNVK